MGVFWHAILTRRDVRQWPARDPGDAFTLLCQSQFLVAVVRSESRLARGSRRLGISTRTVEDHFSAMRQSTGARSLSEAVAYGAAAGLVMPGPPSRNRPLSETRKLLVAQPAIQPGLL
jgi:hypothetical protein